MIKIQLIDKPLQLTPEKEAELVKKYKETGSSVWQQDYIKSALLKMTNGKCAYSEQILGERSAFMEIDHFRCKKLYPDEVVRWGNLLPSCKKCNGAKRETDVQQTPIVNPLFDNPKDYLYIKGLRYYAIRNNVKGENTRQVLDLNNESQFITPKGKLIDKIEDYFNFILQNPSGGLSLRTLKKILEQSGPKYEFSAAISTYILYESKTYRQIESYLKNNNLWDDELERLKSVLLEIAMPKPR